jgi:hypothetical protein
MSFDSKSYGSEAAKILALDGHGARPMPLASSGCLSTEARTLLLDRKAGDLFPQARAAEAARSGLFLYFGCIDEAHEIAQSLNSPEGSYWHAILHRQEPDPGNSAYWFRRVGSHPIFPALRDTAKKIGVTWDPLTFIDFCEEARRQPGSEMERLAMAVQLAEWQLLFDWCAKPAAAVSLH